MLSPASRKVLLDSPESAKFIDIFRKAVSMESVNTGPPNQPSRSPVVLHSVFTPPKRSMFALLENLHSDEQLILA